MCRIYYKDMHKINGCLILWANYHGHKPCRLQGGCCSLSSLLHHGTLDLMLQLTEFWSGVNVRYVNMGLASYTCTLIMNIGIYMTASCTMSCIHNYVCVSAHWHPWSSAVCRQQLHLSHPRSRHTPCPTCHPRRSPRDLHCSLLHRLVEGSHWVVQC